MISNHEDDLRKPTSQPTPTKRPVDSEYMMTWSHPCGEPTKSGKPCGRWVPNQYAFCSWHNGQPRSKADRLALKRERWRQRALAGLTKANQMLAECVREAYPDEATWKRKLKIRRRWVRQFETELASLGQPAEA